jgi:hypothetical protein
MLIYSKASYILPHPINRKLLILTHEKDHPFIAFHAFWRSVFCTTKSAEFNCRNPYQPTKYRQYASCP